MSKHQACANCGRDFVGPDGNIGKNLCGDCHELIHGLCEQRIAELEAEAERLRKACRAIVAWDKAEKSARPFDDDAGAAFTERCQLCYEAMRLAHDAVKEANDRG